MEQTGERTFLAIVNSADSNRDRDYSPIGGPQSQQITKIA